MRLTIIKDDNMIIKDALGYNADLSVFEDLSWVEGYDLKTWGRFQAFQWYGDPDEDGEYGPDGRDEPYGEIEFKKPVQNVIVDELGVYAQAISLWENAKVAEEERIAAEEAELLRLQQEEEARIREAYEALERETSAALQEIQDQMEEVEQSYQNVEHEMEQAMSNEEEETSAMQLEEELERLLADL